ncbi:Gfo/Idh/MocA family protein [Gryllotalpicola protaetiae]|uniref:Gfo/Idh/MocA family oxidoreductase n=1 Tax=Gryllotalpicola protaetiae TaxID=2419771 RepID=A0A387BNS6_9MICO|nr:Gfo/Idh/MocA family oxidoreductase [Gryllotalpicola protaetiae]AYG02647.1 gfo/Idh/MocA family oxidoreductase [Gryllotalpicola protaetiae]
MSTADASLTAALVGNGIIATNHVRALARQGGVRVAVLVDPDSEARAKIASLIVAETGWPAPAQFDSLTAALAAGAPDLVIVATPSGTHVELALEALAAGAHVVIEKPLDTTVGKALPLARAAREASARGQIVSVISQHRFDPASVVVADAAHGGALGRVTSAVASVAWWRSQDYYDSGAWRGTWALDGGGSTMNQGVHTVDLLVWFLGRPVAVFAYAAALAHERIEVEDTLAATVRFANGAIAVLHTTTAAFPGLSVRVNVHGSKGSAQLDRDQLEYFYAEPAEGTDPAVLGDTHVDPTRVGPRNLASGLVPAEHLAGGPVPDDAFVQGHSRQYDDIVGAIREGRAPKVGVDDALRSLAVVRALYVSASLGREVLVSEVLAGQYDDLVPDPAATQEPL